MRMAARLMSTDSLAGRAPTSFLRSSMRPRSRSEAHADGNPAVLDFRLSAKDHAEIDRTRLDELRLIDPGFGPVWDEH